MATTKKNGASLTDILAKPLRSMRNIAIIAAGAAGLYAGSQSAQAAEPAANDDNFTVQEITDVSAPEVELPVLANDLAPNGPARVTAVGTPAHGTMRLQVDPDGSTHVFYRPTPVGFSGDDASTYRMTDGTTSKVAAINIHVNSAPQLQNDRYFMQQGDRVSAFPLVNDGPAGKVLHINSFTPISAAEGTAQLRDTAIDYISNPDFSGFVTMTLDVADQNGGSGQEVVAFEVNGRPVPAANLNIQLNKNSTGNIQVVANATDPEGDPMTLDRVVTSGDGFTASTNAGDIVVTVDGQSGLRAIPYEISDNRGGIAQGVASVNVVNRAPLANPDTYNVRPSSTSLYDVLGNDIDPDGDAISLASIGTPVDQSGNAIPGVSASIVNGQIKVSVPNMVGTVQIPYTISDVDGAQASSNITLNVVNHNPTAADDNVQTKMRRTVTIDVLANDSDADGDPISLVGVGAPVDAAGNPIEGVGVAVVDGKVQVSIPNDQYSQIRIPYTIQDSFGATSGANINIAVSPLDAGDFTPTPNETDYAPLANKSGKLLTKSLDGKVEVFARGDIARGTTAKWAAQLRKKQKEDAIKGTDKHITFHDGAGAPYVAISGDGKILLSPIDKQGADVKYGLEINLFPTIDYLPVNRRTLQTGAETQSPQPVVKNAKFVQVRNDPTQATSKWSVQSPKGSPVKYSKIDVRVPLPRADGTVPMEELQITKRTGISKDMALPADGFFPIAEVTGTYVNQLCADMGGVKVGTQYMTMDALKQMLGTVFTADSTLTVYNDHFTNGPTKADLAVNGKNYGSIKWMPYKDKQFPSVAPSYAVTPSNLEFKVVQVGQDKFAIRAGYTIPINVVTKDKVSGALTPSPAMLKGSIMGDNVGYNSKVGGSQ